MVAFFNGLYVCVDQQACVAGMCMSEHGAGVRETELQQKKIWQTPD